MMEPQRLNALKKQVAIRFGLAAILNEEKVLLRDLPGYNDYCRKEPYRLLPYIW